MARKKGYIKTFSSLWTAHENLYCSLFYEALKLLEITDLAKNENAISEALCPIFNDLCFKHCRDVTPPMWEVPNQPSTNDELKGGKKSPKPDFSCNLINPFANGSDMYQIPFHIECKKLGEKVGSWNLNKNYVNNGINRFDSNKHEYGKKAISGLMVGYIVSMEPIAILEEVNGHLPEQLQKLTFVFVEKVVSCEQSIIRKEVNPKDFKLIHIWVNLKN
ncbi:TPA: hypothetical protein DIC62_02710 [Candidatus Nomurabacteria bacterium]|nr:hypothetical protein [Candidatus Nomurabacteria bacterium]